MTHRRRHLLLWFIRLMYFFMCLCVVRLAGISFAVLMVAIWWKWEQAVVRYHLNRTEDFKWPTARAHAGRTAPDSV
jgi:hypothetical protein